MPFLCINCDHNVTTRLDPPWGYAPDEVCFVCIEEEAIRFATLIGEDVTYALEHLIDYAGIEGS